MYKFMAILSILIRQFCLPDPFEFLGEYSWIVNWIVGLILPAITYKTVGIIYEKNSIPFIGSLLYLLFFSMFTILLWIMGKFHFVWWIDIIAVVVLTLFYRFLFVIREKFIYE